MLKYNFGCKNCHECNSLIIHKIKRDIERKKFCSRKCLGSYTVKNKLKPEHLIKMQKAANTEESNAKKGNPGENHPKWVKDRSKVKKRPRYEMKIWTQAIFKRDNYICQHCGIRGGKLQADHIKPYSKFPELRWYLENGRTLCIPCHKKTDTYGIKMRWYNARGQ